MNGSGEWCGVYFEEICNDSYCCNCPLERSESFVEEAFLFYTKSIALNIIGLFGIVGNIISMIILSRPQMRSSINYLLIALARCDTVIIIASMLLYGCQDIFRYTGYFHDYLFRIYPVITSVTYPLSHIAHTMSVYLTVIVTVERFVAVCHPLRVKSLCTYGRARWYVIGITLFSIIYNLPKWFESQIVSDEYYIDNNTALTRSCIAASDLRHNKLYVKIYIHWSYLIVMNIFPFISLAILNSFIYKQVRRANAERQRLSRIQKKEIGLATMLLVVVLVFFVCNLMALITNTLEVVIGAETLTSLVAVSNLLVTINSSVNFVIYVIFGEKFKKLFLKMFCTRKKYRDGSPDRTEDDSYASNGVNKNSLRLHRYGTSISRNGSLYGNGSGKRSIRRAASPIPVVYYPQRTRPSRTYTTMTNLTTPSDWTNQGDSTSF